MATNEPIRNWKFVYNRLIGTIGEGDQAKEIRASHTGTTGRGTYVWSSENFIHRVVKMIIGE